MTIEKLEELLESGEGFTIEYKECVNGLNNSVFETVCSFSNRYGGYMLLGVKEVDKKGVVIGVNPNCIVDMKKNFVMAGFMTVMKMQIKTCLHQRI